MEEGVKKKKRNWQSNLKKKSKEMRKGNELNKQLN